MERCARCGASLGAGHRFCADCGASVGGCPSCGKPTIPRKPFCPACGHGLGESASGSSAASAMVREFPGWADELRSLQAPTLLIFGDRDFSPLPDVVEMFELLPDTQLAVLPRTTHAGVMRRSGQVLALITPSWTVSIQPVS